MSLTFWNNAFTLLSAVNLPLQESELTNFYVKHAREFRALEVPQEPAPL